MQETFSDQSAVGKSAVSKVEIQEMLWFHLVPFYLHHLERVHTYEYCLHISSTEIHADASMRQTLIVKESGMSMAWRPL